jgi:hypothetical protein
MSQNKDHATTTPKTERWVKVMALAFVPVTTALFVPEVARMPLIAIGGLMFLVGFVLMLRQSRQSRDGEGLKRMVCADPE